MACTLSIEFVVQWLQSINNTSFVLSHSLCFEHCAPPTNCWKYHQQYKKIILHPREKLGVSYGNLCLYNLERSNRISFHLLRLLPCFFFFLSTGPENFLSTVWVVPVISKLAGFLLQNGMPLRSSNKKWGNQWVNITLFLVPSEIMIVSQ